MTKPTDMTKEAAKWIIGGILLILVGFTSGLLIPNALGMVTNIGLSFSGGLAIGCGILTILDH